MKYKITGSAEMIRVEYPFIVNSQECEMCGKLHENLDINLCDECLKEAEKEAKEILETQQTLERGLN